MLPAPKRQAVATAPLIADATAANLIPARDTRRAADCPPPEQPPVIQPIAPERYKLQVTIGVETREKLRRAKDLLRHATSAPTRRRLSIGH